jgi:hypothetical protein
MSEEKKLDKVRVFICFERIVANIPEAIEDAKRGVIDDFDSAVQYLDTEEVVQVEPAKPTKIEQLEQSIEDKQARHDLFGKIAGVADSLVMNLRCLADEAGDVCNMADTAMTSLSEQVTVESIAREVLIEEEVGQGKR